MRLVHVCQQFVCMHASLSPRNAPWFRKFAAQQFARLKLRRLSSWPGKSKSSWRMATLNLREEVSEIRIFLERNPVLLDIAMTPCNAEELAAKLLAEAEIGLLGGDLSDTTWPRCCPSNVRKYVRASPKWNFPLENPFFTLRPYVANVVHDTVIHDAFWCRTFRCKAMNKSKWPALQHAVDHEYSWFTFYFFVSCILMSECFFCCLLTHSAFCWPK